MRESDKIIDSGYLVGDLSFDSTSSVQYEINRIPDAYSSGMNVDGNGADVYVNKNEGLHQRLARIERALGISQRDHELEKEYNDLQKIGDQYENDIDRALEVISGELRKISKRYENAAEQFRILKKLDENND